MNTMWACRLILAALAGAALELVIEHAPGLLLFPAVPLAIFGFIWLLVTATGGDE